VDTLEKTIEETAAYLKLLRQNLDFCANEMKFFPELSLKTKLCGSSWSDWHPELLYFPAAIIDKIHAAGHVSPVLEIITHHYCHWGYGPLSAVNRGLDYNFDPENYTPPEE
jgi:hypothetical protein